MALPSIDKASVVAAIFVAGVAGFAVVRYPSARADAFRLLKIALTSTIPGIVLKQATDAWREAGVQAA